MKNMKNVDMESSSPKVLSSGTINTVPTKYVLWGGVSICRPRNSASELIDNVIDHVSDRITARKPPKTVIIDIQLGKETAVSWNLGVPPDQRKALLTQGMHKATASEVIGTWGQGGKIAIHALGRNVLIETKMPEESFVTRYEYARDWLWNDSDGYNKLNEEDWNVKQETIGAAKGIEFTRIRVAEPSRKVLQEFGDDKTKTSSEALCEYLGETYGMTFAVLESFGIDLSIKVNGLVVKPITFASPEDIKNNFVFVPGFRPLEYTFDFGELNIKAIVGCLKESASKYGGIYFYGNGARLFEKGWKDPDYLEFDTTHPQKKSWQVHLFFNGPEMSIPWHAPLKEGVNRNHEVMHVLRDKLQKIIAPYVKLILATHQGERIAYTESYRTLSDRDKITELLKYVKQQPEDPAQFWDSLPDSAKNGVLCDGIIESDKVDVGDILREVRFRGTEPRNSESAAKKWLKENGITQDNGKTWQGLIKTHQAFAALLAGPGATVTSTIAAPVLAPTSPTAEREVISFRPSDRLQDALIRELGNVQPNRIMQFVDEITELLNELQRAPNLPPEVRTLDGHVEMLKDLIAYFGGRGARASSTPNAEGTPAGDE